MHLKNYPHYYVKGSERRAVYFTGDARDLRSQGWRKEGEEMATPVKKAVEAVIPEPAPVEPERIEVEVVADKPKLEELPSFEFMTKTELLSYAMDRGVDLPNNMLKAELIAECKKLAAA